MWRYAENAMFLKEVFQKRNFDKQKHLLSHAIFTNYILQRNSSRNTSSALLFSVNASKICMINIAEGHDCNAVTKLFAFYEFTNNICEYSIKCNVFQVRF